MARSNDSWGVEVGANAVKAVRLTAAGKDVHLEEYEILPFKQVLTTPDLNADEAVQVQLDALMQKHDLTKSNVVVSVPGHLAFARFAKLPPVEPKKIPDIVRFEAVQQIPFPIDQVEWDYQVFQQQDSPDVEVGIFAITKERVASFLSNYRQVGMRVDALTLSPLAVYNAFAYETRGDSDASTGTIYMDIGTQSTDVIIVENGGIWLRTLPIGGNNFTDALVKSFKLSFAKAEKLKKEAGTSKYARQIFQAMRPVFADLVQEMQRSLGYYQSLNRDAELKRLVGVGSTFRLPGLQKFLKQQLQMDVVRPDGFKRIHVEGKDESDFAENALNMATAYGLALQGLGLESVTANVLPQAILRQRLWKAKQPWIAAAAACVAVASGAAAARYFYENRTYESAKAASDPMIQPILNQAQSLKTRNNEVVQSAGGDPRLRIENLRRILDYRDVWPRILADITSASQAMNPQPALTSSESYDEVRAIPTTQRRRFYIQKVSANYLVGAAPAAAAAGGAAPDPATLLAAQDLSTYFAEGTPPPRFEITITGYTPFGNAASDAVRAVSEGFINRLQQISKQQGRPYALDIDTKNAIVRQFPLNFNAGTTGPGGTSRSGPGAPPAGPFGGPNRPNSPFGPGAPAGPFGGGSPFGQPQPGGGSAITSATGEPLIPRRPLSDEPMRATGFEIKFTVKLLRPEEARRSEDRPRPAEPQPGTPVPAGQPAPETPAPAPAPDQPAAQGPATTTEQEVSL